MNSTGLWKWTVAAGAMLLMGLACNTHELNPFQAAVRSAAVDSTEQGEVRAVDILFVVDSSNSMCEEQTILRNNFNRFIEQLVDANADFQLAVVNTDVVDVVGGFGQFRTQPGTYNNVGACTQTVPDTSNCPASVGPILTREAYLDEATGMVDQARLQEDFACMALTGIDGSPVEMGLEAMRLALGNQQQANAFLRPGALLSVVFVTDENDCSDGTRGAEPGPVFDAVQGGAGDSACEYNRNIEDSCTLAMNDELVQGEDGTYSPTIFQGDNVDFDGVTLSQRDWCAQGNRGVVEQLAGAGSLPIACEGTGCTNQLVPRSEYYDFLLQTVAGKNEQYYRDNGLSEPEEFLAEAANDIILATILNTDAGVRYQSTEPVPTWCGGAGTQGYRYQQLAEMFPQDRRVIAPICDVTGDITGMQGEPVNFADSLEKIAATIGRAINSICLQSRPMTCTTNEDCPNEQTCEEQVYFSNNPNLSYRLCSGFRVKVEQVTGTDPEGNPILVELSEGMDYTIEYEAGACVGGDGSGSPLQVSFTSAPATGTQLIVSYPRDVSAVF